METYALIDTELSWSQVVANIETAYLTTMMNPGVYDWNNDGSAVYWTALILDVAQRQAAFISNPVEDSWAPIHEDLSDASDLVKIQALENYLVLGRALTSYEDEVITEGYHLFYAIANGRANLIEQGTAA